ncbi:MAG TPA: HAMP domain-containing sensor histidine kinase [Prolixibacteraceae bacterium]|nr:HAMP domain-containing sensor histidine kinase [Prolixibacteraceae bacterium]
MKEFRKYIFYLLSGLFFILAAIQEYQILNKHPEAKLIQNFQKTILNQEAKLSEYLNDAGKRIADSVSADNCTSTFSDFNQLFEKEGIGLVIFRDQKMVYWSSNQFTFPNLQNRIPDQNRLLTLPNGIYLTQKRIVGNHELTGLIHIKTNYSYENQFLENSFVPPFNLPSGFKISSARDQNAVEIHDQTNQYLFSVLPSGAKRLNESQLYFPALLYMLGFLFLLLSLYQKIREYKDENFVTKMFLVLVVLFVIYWIHMIFRIPIILNHFGIFTAQFYALSSWLPSLGDFFLITVLFFFWSLVFVRELILVEDLKKQFVIPAFVFAGSMYQLVGFMIENLIRNSNITYRLNRITDIDQYSISSYLAIAILLFSVFLIHLKIIQRTEYFFHNRFFLKFNLVAVIISIALSFLFPSGWSYILTLFFGVNLLQCQIRKMHITIYSLSYSILFISLFSVISLLIIYNTIKNREIQVQKLLAINLSSEQDPVAEVLLARMQNQFNTDAVIPSLLSPPYNKLENYLTHTYFSGYFRKYDIQYTFCTGSESVLIQPENISEPCFPFFDQRIERFGINIPGSKFYFMNYMDGRVSYLGNLHYQLVDDSRGISAFIEINSKIISEGIGFPELLMDRSLIKPFRYKYLSYAKYFDEELVNRSGEYAYNYYLQSYNLGKAGPEFRLMKWDGYDHLIYAFDENNHIIVSNRSLTFLDYLISFPYIFVFYFLVVLTIAVIGNSNFRKLIIPKDLRFRIQVSIISVVLVSLLFVATGTIYYNIQEYRSRHKVDLQEKIKSVSEEIKSRLIYVNSINPELQQWLYTELYKLSNIFRTDISIYNVNGELIATSRPEIFAKGIISDQMNANAFYELSERYQLNYFQPEKIGNLSYLSAYEPIINNRGDYLGYINLPYFTREDDLKQSISTFVVAFINLYLILFLASVIVAVVLSNKITQPLSLIREKLRGIQLGKKNEQINYLAEDEIGALVKEYNHKVEELVESAELLARSERESAWREMAKQIAHEIKNPLTPMKLNIQYLQKAKAEGNEHYDDFFNRVTKNLIEQIDTLSGIATEFSNFAQAPKAKNEVFNLIEVLQNVSLLFEPNKNLHFTLEMDQLTEVLIFADKEQLSRAFLNLVKNAIQSIPAERNGEIRMTVRKAESLVRIGISDNGAGISKEAQRYLFEPNFTTKTSGMGLGLSIVRNIITNFRGKIWYETSEAEGTTFYVEIPLYETTPTAENNISS